MGLFGTKIACGQCDRKVKEKDAIYRRQLRFCSQACVDQFLAEHPVRPAAGSPDQLREEAARRLVAALGELLAAGRRTGTGDLSFKVGNVTLSVDVTGHAFVGQEDAIAGARDSLYRFDSLVMESLPYFYGLGKRDVIEYLEKLDVEPLRVNAPPGSAVDPIAAHVKQILMQL